ncbi:NAD-glutamate dehydrogenase [Azorhizobium oxalatiphilum]|uniref:NAD-glutamate dehydrogenase n=1 Tax=Azorhizobium oxalatiphilum TaxID=980631 RepID=A0A917C8U7_9HYPH|nr:NAD-glutamate dehydrogenase [Azorhizobium oxalatiphilum]GGF78476.1 NAD-glutamate dehydrogenase [Azorhizobium oxalatiphilum]
MNIQGSQGADTFGHKARLSMAVSLLKADGARVPEAFTRQLFGSAAPEDVEALLPEAIAALARTAWGHLSAHKPGASDVHVFTPALPGQPAITVVETVNDDMSFLFDSVAAELTDRGIEVQLVTHPIFALERAGASVTGVETDLAAAAGRGLKRESLIHLHIPALGGAEAEAELREALLRVLADVRAANTDFLAMRGRVAETADRYRDDSAPYTPAERLEAADLADWLVDDNFIFLGLRAYALTPEGGLEAVPESGLGVLRDPAVHELRLGSEPVVTTPEIRQFLAGGKPLIITKSSLRSKVHRRVFLDYVGVKLHDDEGRLTGELRVIGLFTSTTYTHSVAQIPYLRTKSEAALHRAGLDPDSHSGKALATVLETYPRDDLFQIDLDTLQAHALDILSLYDRPRVRVLPRVDAFDRFVSVLVFAPRERFDASLRKRVGAALAQAYAGQVAAVEPVFLVDLPLTRVHYIIGRQEGRTPDVNRDALEKDISRLSLTWADRLRDALFASHGMREAQQLAERYGNAFDAGYIAAYGVQTAVEDIARLERLSDARPVALDFYRGADDTQSRISLRLLSHGRPLPLSQRVPMLENMGLRAIDESSYEIEAKGRGNSEAALSWVHEMSLERTDGRDIEVSGSAERLEDLLTAVLRDEAYNDGFNALVLDTQLNWREVALVRALARYLRQAGIAFSQDYLWTTLVHHAGVAEKIVRLFHIRFDPSRDETLEARAARETPLREAIEAALADVSSLDEDRILRRFVNLVDAALRTTFYQPDADGQPRPVIAIKYESAKVEALPLPLPLYEVFVYSPQVEGVHLRFGPVARGGLRWSDRPQDFRTEVLGLVKAQQVKNAVIVPVGAKGGFVPKRLPANGTREAIQAEGISAYKTFVSSLLDLTDDLKGGEVVHPRDVVRLDGDDPYLVVAADKGTATFSDTANAISQAHGFWLDDAFASGGSVGYDHKAMGITARGAWEAVKRHFRELNVDIQTTPVTVVGVGDMSGDVFGNGMLLSKALKLVAAFDHRHIFLDPTPDPAKAHAERERMFALPRSSWADYDPALISQGGGVFARTAKRIPLSPEVRALLGLDKPEAAPAEVMTAILKAKADLLWFGGIGTYVRSSQETDAQVGDRANDAIRIAASDLRVKVVGEGANLGMTQRGRIEAGRKGVKLNTDAIDNSAGVNTSDVEVNIKVALSLPVAEGALSAPERAKLLAEMTPDVAALVLRNNYLQPLALSLAERRGTEDLAFQQRMMQVLEGRGELDRAVEYLPSDSEIGDRRSRNESLTRPELAVLLAYAKLSLYADLLASDVPDDAYLAHELQAYFPAALRERFPEAIAAHRLRREIIATGLANAIVNQGGPAGVTRIADQTGADAAGIARAFAAVRDSYRLGALNAAIDALDTQVDGEVQLALYKEVQSLMIGRTIWFLRNVSFADGIAGVVERYGAAIAAIGAGMDASLPESWRAARDRRVAELISKRVPQALALDIAVLPALAVGSDIAQLAERTGRGIAEVAPTFFAAGRYFAVDDIVTSARAITAPDYYDRLALDRALAQMETFTRQITAEVLAQGGTGEEGVEAWVEHRRKEVDRIRATVQDITASGLTLSKLTLAANLLGDLARG